MKFAIETVEMKGHCSAGKTICESKEKNSVGRKGFIVRKPTEWRDGVRQILPAVEQCLRVCFSNVHIYQSIVERYFLISVARVSVRTVLHTLPTQFVTLTVTTDCFPLHFSRLVLCNGDS
jgi:hypothetical protein